MEKIKKIINILISKGYDGWDCPGTYQIFFSKLSGDSLGESFTSNIRSILPMPIGEQLHAWIVGVDDKHIYIKNKRDITLSPWSWKGTRCPLKRKGKREKY